MVRCVAGVQRSRPEQNAGCLAEGKGFRMLWDNTTLELDVHEFLERASGLRFLNRNRAAFAALPNIAKRFSTK